MWVSCGKGVVVPGKWADSPVRQPRSCGAQSAAAGETLPSPRRADSPGPAQPHSPPCTAGTLRPAFWRWSPRAAR